MTLPIFDLHCDLLVYLAHVKNAHYNNTEDIGVALPYLRKGNVKLQTLAIYAPTKAGSVSFTTKQIESYQSLIEEPYFSPVKNIADIDAILSNDKVGVIPAIENASGLGEENEPLDLVFTRLEDMINAIGPLLYIGFTHHHENRFGGGNYSDNVGLKKDGEHLLDFLDGKKIAVDLSHTSDNLAFGIFNYIEAKSLDVCVIASHSNFRPLHNHVRNLPDELTQAVVNNKGLIGMNFLRAYIHDTEPAQLLEHMLYGFAKSRAPEHIAFGADFFDRLGITDPARMPLFFTEHEDASKYPILLNQLRERGITDKKLEGIAYQNTLNFLKRLWN